MSLFVRIRNRFSGPVASATAGHAPARSTRPRRFSCATVPYILLVDESGSTSSALRVAGGRTVTRMQAIQDAAARYLRMLSAANPRQPVAVIGFTDGATVYHRLAPVGPAFHSLTYALRQLHPQGYTNLSAGLTSALRLVADAGTPGGTLVIVTDGAANLEKDLLPGLVERAKTSRVRIHTIGVGNNGDGDYDRALLLHIARSTGGRFSSADSFGALCNALSRVA